MILGPNFKIKFQQYDNFPMPTDGRGYDNIQIVIARHSRVRKFAPQRQLRDGELFGLVDGRNGYPIPALGGVGVGFRGQLWHADDGTARRGLCRLERFRRRRAPCSSR